MKNTSSKEVWRKETKEGSDREIIKEVFPDLNLNQNLLTLNQNLLTIREQAGEWFASKTYLEQHELSDKYFESRNPSLLTIEQVEEIYNKEILEPKRQEEWQESQVNCKYTKPNAKEFKQFDESLFKAYISKFSNEDKLKMLAKLSCEISTVNPILNDLLNRISCYGGNK